ncbi:MAG: hypothetical protein MKZ81_00640 [Dehalococcoidia bacterium]|nr:hypothetical protein [Dehalococcoidia bacterium]
MVNEGSYDIERIISDGLRPVRALYWSAIQQIAHQLVQEFPGDVLKSLAASDRLDELVRESDWFYMPLQAWVTHLVTDNAGAYWSYIDKHKTEIKGIGRKSNTMTDVVQIGAFYAMCADVEQSLQTATKTTWTSDLL